jgi:antibiotic biosynthesis monooxygenase (ABM) superfamily enzyme
MNAIVLVVLYPLTLILPDLVRQILPHSSKPTVQLITASVAVSLLGFWLVPLVSGWMTTWLYTKRFVPQAIGGTCLATFLYGIWQLAYLMKI